MSINTALGVLLPIVFCGCVVTLVFLRMTRRRTAAQHRKARYAFAEALATKNIKINATDVETKQGADGVILCEVMYERYFFASGEYRPKGEVFVRFYPRQDNDPDWSFSHPAAPNH